jgi:anti-sigma-K factor RskA
LNFTCEQCRDELPEYALGSLDAAQVGDVAAHLATCESCRREFAAAQAAWTALPLALAPIEPSRELIDRILARIDGASASKGAAATYRPSRRERVLSYLVAAAVLIGLTVGFWKIAQPQDDAAVRRSAEKFAERLGNLQEMERLLAADNVRLVSLKRNEGGQSVEAYVIWDLAAGQWHFYANHLPAPPSGHGYQAWIVNHDGRYSPGPMLSVDEHGLGTAIVDLPRLGVRHAAKAAVTLEPAAGSKQPTGKVILEAAL